MNTCYKCGTGKDLIINSRRSRVDGSVFVRMVCRSCNTEKLREYRRTDAGKRAVARAVGRYEASHPGYKKAWAKAGYLLALRPCEVCGTTLQVHRHHEDISKPLDVMFLCPVHHKARHRQLKPLQLALV